MAFSTGAQTQVAYIAETTYGTTPTLGGSPEVSTQVVGFINNNINLSKAIFEDPTINANRQVTFSAHGNKQIGGDVSFAYAQTEFDSFLESVMFSTFASNVLKIGSTLKSFTVEIGATDIAQYRVFTGIVANNLTLEVNLDGVVASTFGMIGKDMVVGTTSIDTTPTAAPVKSPFVHINGTFKEGGSSTGIITSISLNIENNITPNFALGDASLKELTPGMINVSGQVTVYFQDAVLLAKFIAETESTIEFTLDDGSSNTHTYLLPRVKYNAADISVTDGNTVPITIPFVALYDTSTATTLQITRSS